jgi:transcription initiation factor TFIID subunit TAF12
MAYTPYTSGYGTGVTSTSTNQAAAPAYNPADFLNTILPGTTTATSSALSNVQDLLTGNPSPDITRNANAYFGAQSGMPGSDFIRNRGFDIYNQASDARKQQGLGDLSTLIGTVAGPTLTAQGQYQQNQQFGQSQAQQNQQFQQNQQLQDFLAQLQAIGLGNSAVNANRPALPNLNI